MQTISELKSRSVTETPLILFDCVLHDGRQENWSTHKVTVSGRPYEPRILRHSSFEIQSASDLGIDTVPRITLVLANADSHFSQLERTVGFKGAKLTARFLFYNLDTDEAESESTVLFQGICNSPDEILEGTCKLSAINRLHMQRVVLPSVRIQRRCPWNFPGNAAQRQEAIDGGSEGKYSRFYRCGYSAGEAGGEGQLNGHLPYTSCGYTRDDCQARGVSSHFGGLEFVPSSIVVRTAGDKTAHTSAIQPNEARYNDFVPLVYGTAWYTPPVVFSRNDGNLTRMEVLLGLGEIQGVLKVLVNDVEIPQGQAGTKMTGTGWYNVPTLGTRAGGFNLDFTTASGTPAGDPYGSMAYLAVVVPNRINDGGSIPTVQVLVQGLKLPIYGPDGIYQGEYFSNNPAWILMDLLRRSGWMTDEIDIPSFASAAAYCDEQILASDLNANAVYLARYQCNLVVQKRRSAGDLIRGVRNGALIQLSYGSSGKLTAVVENRLAVQQPSRLTGSNAVNALDGGWPAFEFGDGTYGLSGIVRRDNGESTFRIWTRSSTDTGNRVAVEFQDAMNQYQQDSLSLVDGDDVAKSGQELTAPLSVLGIPNFSQAVRILRLSLDKFLRGNLFVEFETSVDAVMLRPGDIVSVTYLKEGFDRQLFRLVKISPAVNFQSARLTCQLHSDAWYSDQEGDFKISADPREGKSGIGLPRPIGPAEVGPDGEAAYHIEESHSGEELTERVSLSVQFSAPRRPEPNGPCAPLIDLTPQVVAGGTLEPGTYYYCVSAVDADGREGPLSFTVRATIMVPGSSVRLAGLSFGTGSVSFRTYRGDSPARLFQCGTEQPISAEFLYSGLGTSTTPPPDANFDHANFYWRSELQPEQQATSFSATTIGNAELQMIANRYRGCVVRITKGSGAGQERVIGGNTPTNLTVAPPWDLLPNTSSRFAIAEGSWKFGALAASSPAAFEVPNHPGEVVQLCGRSANVNDNECALEISTVTRWSIGGTSGADTLPPPTPIYGLGPGRRGGTLEVSGVAFQSLANTRTISSGTLTLYYWNELNGMPSLRISQAVTPADTSLSFGGVSLPISGDTLQLGGEICRVTSVDVTARTCIVDRGLFGTERESCQVADPIFPLEQMTVVMPFARGFFGSPYSGNWSYPISLPDVRVAGATLFMTNGVGNSDETSIALTGTSTAGLRTLSGGQYTLQVEGFLAVDPAPAPALIVDSTHAVRDIFAVIGVAADSPVHIEIRNSGTVLGLLSIPAGHLTSNSIDGFGIPPLAAGSQLSMAILSVGLTNPGANLTVVVRL